MCIYKNTWNSTATQVIICTHETAAANHSNLSPPAKHNTFQLFSCNTAFGRVSKVCSLFCTWEKLSFGSLRVAVPLNGADWILSLRDILNWQLPISSESVQVSSVFRATMFPSGPEASGTARGRAAYLEQEMGIFKSVTHLKSQTDSLDSSWLSLLLPQQPLGLCSSSAPVSQRILLSYYSY